MEEQTIDLLLFCGDDNFLIDDEAEKVWTPSRHLDGVSIDFSLDGVNLNLDVILRLKFDRGFNR